MLPMREVVEPSRVDTLEEARKVLDLSDTTFRLPVHRGEIKGRRPDACGASSGLTFSSSLTGAFCQRKSLDDFIHTH